MLRQVVVTLTLSITVLLHNVGLLINCIWGHCSFGPEVRAQKHVNIRIRHIHRVIYSHSCEAILSSFLKKVEQLYDSKFSRVTL